MLPIRSPAARTMPITYAIIWARCGFTNTIRCPASFELQYFLAGSYRRLDDTSQAKAEYRRAHQMKPRSAPVLLNLAFLELRQGNAREAQRYLELARQILPNDRAIGELLQAIATGQATRILAEFQKSTDPDSSPSPVP